MKILMINVVCGIRSTGRICTDLAEMLEKQGHEVKIAYGRGEVPEELTRKTIRIGNNFDMFLHILKSRLFDSSGFGSKNATKKFLNWVDEYQPDLIWMHNLHGYYINISMLFEWIKNNPQVEVKWTLHDCWAFTGHCAYFSMVKCSKWKEQCLKCPQTSSYPKSIFKDNSFKNYNDKKKAVTGVPNLSLVVPSCWLKNLVKQSFLKEYPVEVRYNTVNKNVFKPVENDFKKKYGIEDKIMILGVAAVWDERKGLNDFLELAKMLDDRYIIVLVGLNSKQIKRMPGNIMGLQRTVDDKELAMLYTAADVFVNPSKEETFGMTTIEAESCGTPAIVYRDTACEEIVHNTSGIAVKQNVESLYNAIISQIYLRENTQKV